ncbi:hypothetical protein OAJ86_00185 [Nitrosopumilus sp.]|nr:hypothetical protein [Nitrosopumilus sp.]
MSSDNISNQCDNCGQEQIPIRKNGFEELHCSTCEAITASQLIGEKEFKENPENWTAKEKEDKHDQEIINQEEQLARMADTQQEILFELKNISRILERMDKHIDYGLGGMSTGRR